MKKLIILLLVMVIGAGAVFAATFPDHPPGVFTLDTALSENSGYEAVVTSDTVLVLVTPVTADPSSLQAVMANDNFIAIRPQSGFIIMTDLKSNDQASAAVDFYLRL